MKTKQNKKGNTARVTGPRARSYAAIAIALSGVVALLICQMIHLKHFQDDAFISFRYLRNFIDGEGLVFNPGERVEGYTNFLWILLLRIPAFFKLDIPATAQYLSSLFGAMVPVLTYILSCRLEKESEKATETHWTTQCFFALIPAALIIATPAFAYWAVSAMETSLFIALLLASLIAYDVTLKSGKLPYLYSGLLAASALTRPEGILFFIIIAIHRKRNSTNRANRKDFAKEAAVFIIPVLAHFIFRFVYYGDLIPNTFYAKASFSAESVKSGFAYLVSFLCDYQLCGALLLTHAIFIVRKEHRSVTMLLYALIIPYAMYVVAVGGDVLSQHRFWMPVLPLLSIVTGLAVKNLYLQSLTKWPGRNRSFTFLHFFAVLVLCGYLFVSNIESLIKSQSLEIQLTEKQTEIAKVLNALQEQEQKQLTVAASTIGALSYYGKFNVLDVLGLTNPVIALHPGYIREISNDSTVGWKEKKYNADYVLNRRPDYLLFSTGIKPSAYAERAYFAGVRHFVPKDCKKPIAPVAEYERSECIEAFELAQRSVTPICRTPYFAYPQFFRDYRMLYVRAPSMMTVYLYGRKTPEQAAFTNHLVRGAINPLFIRDYVAMLDATGSSPATTRQHFNEVARLYSGLLTTAPSFFADHHRLMAGAHAAIGDFNSAKTAFERALAADPLHLPSLFGISGVCRRLNDMKAFYFYADRIERFKLVKSVQDKSLQ